VSSLELATSVRGVQQHATTSGTHDKRPGCPRIEIAIIDAIHRCPDIGFVVSADPPDQQASVVLRCPGCLMRFIAKDQADSVPHLESGDFVANLACTLVVRRCGSAPAAEQLRRQ
jgi:hypothetical protein